MRKWNFSAGHAAIPEEVAKLNLKCLNVELVMSVMEMSHRSSEYIDLAKQARKDLTDLKIKHYQVLFLQGGATLQFSMIP